MRNVPDFVIYSRQKRILANFQPLYRRRIGSRIVVGENKVGLVFEVDGFEASHVIEEFVRDTKPIFWFTDFQRHDFRGRDRRQDPRIVVEPLNINAKLWGFLDDDIPKRIREFLVGVRHAFILNVPFDCFTGPTYAFS
jgi:hypothetical protein